MSVDKNDLWGENTRVTQSLTREANNSIPKVTLYLIPPTHISDHCRRAHTYKFGGGNFQADLTENVEKALTQRNYSYSDTYMPGSRSALEAILPSANGERVNLNYFSECWKFILIIDNASEMSELGIATINPGRKLYEGWVAGGEEPATMGLDGNIHINETAVLSTTHHTSLLIDKTLGFGGSAGERIHVIGDYDYVDGSVAQAIAPRHRPQELCDLTPSKVMNVISEDTETGMFNTGTTSIAGTNHSIELDSSLNNPKVHLSTVVGGLVDSSKNYAENSNIDGDCYTDINNFIKATSSLMNTGSNSYQILDPSVPHTLGEIRNKFDNALEVIVCDLGITNYENSDPCTPSRRNVMSSIINSSLPSLLAENSIASVKFRYNSWISSEFEEGCAGKPRGSFQLLGISPLYHLDDNRITKAWIDFKRSLRDKLWPIIIHNAGEFDVMVHCSLAGASLIQLNLYDWHDSDKGYIETNNLLGGLNTPLLGTVDDFKNNATELYGTVQNIVNSVPGVGDSIFRSNMLPDSSNDGGFINSSGWGKDTSQQYW